MRISEVINQAVRYVNNNLLTDSPDMRKPSRDLRTGAGTLNFSGLIEAHKGKQPAIYGIVEPYEVFLVHPNRASAGYLGIRTHKQFSKLRFREEDGYEIRPVELCIQLRDPDTWIDFSYLVSNGTIFAVSPKDRQPIDWEPESANVVYVNRAYRNESLAVARIAQKAVRSYRQRQQFIRHIRES